MTKTKQAVEIARKKLVSIASEIAEKYGLELHTVHFSAIPAEDGTQATISARMCYTDTRNEQVSTTRE